MIYSNDITIPVLCPINFSEAKETTFYPEQEYFIPSIPSTLKIMFLISDAMYVSTDPITILFRHHVGYTVKTVEMTRATNGSYKYAHAIFSTSDIPTNFIGYIEIELTGTESLAKSVLYKKQIDTKYEKTLSYNNAKNDWNTVFDTTDFKITIPCGFNPTNYSAKRKVENYQDQDIQNVNIYSQPYDTEVATIGAPYGVPNWMYRKLNAIFACDTIQIDDVEYKVAEGANLEKKDNTYEGLHILEIELQPLNNYKQ